MLLQNIVETLRCLKYLCQILSDSPRLKVKGKHLGYCDCLMLQSEFKQGRTEWSRYKASD